MDLSDIEQMTIQYGEGWGFVHVRRVLVLIDLIGADIPHDPEALRLAVYLHDWGAFPKFYQPGTDHAQRSKQIAEKEILPTMNLTKPSIEIILEAIELHDYRNPQPTRSSEAHLLREADSLDFLGIIGIAREFAWGPNNLQRCYERSLCRMERIKEQLTIPAAQTIAAQRLTRMKAALEFLAEESFGFL
jgi:uncharacterized protein